MKKKPISKHQKPDVVKISNTRLTQLLNNEPESLTERLKESGSEEGLAGGYHEGGQAGMMDKSTEHRSTSTSESTDEKEK